MQNEARKANQTAMVAEKKKMEAVPESRGISKQKWLEDRKKKNWKTSRCKWFGYERSIYARYTRGS